MHFYIRRLRSAALATLLLAPILPAIAQVAPQLVRVEASPDGYVLIGRGFGTDRSKIQIFEGNTSLQPAAIVSVANDRIAVRSRPTGTVQHKVVLDRLSSPAVSFTHAAAPALAAVPGKPAPAAAPPAPPQLMRVVAAPTGYALLGSGFGTDALRLEVFEGSAKVPAASIASVANERIAVNARLTGTVQHRVVVSGQSSQSLAFAHPTPAPAAAAPAPPGSGTSPPPAAAAATTPPATSKPAAAPTFTTKTLTLGTVSATGYRADAAAPAKTLTLGTVSATGYLAEVAPPRSLTLGTVSAEGYRE